MGGVDWNSVNHDDLIPEVRHHPHGWCGLKYTTIAAMQQLVKSPPTWVVWIEINLWGCNQHWCVSPPTWVVWIEMGLKVDFCCLFLVTTHMGGVDWNSIKINIIHNNKVTTHMGGVDWNISATLLLISPDMSPPTWVVWIEIVMSDVNWVAVLCHHPHGWCGLKSF